MKGNLVEVMIIISNTNPEKGSENYCKTLGLLIFMGNLGDESLLCHTKHNGTPLSNSVMCYNCPLGNYPLWQKIT